MSERPAPQQQGWASPGALSGSGLGSGSRAQGLVTERLSSCRPVSPGDSCLPGLQGCPQSTPKPGFPWTLLPAWVPQDPPRKRPAWAEVRHLRQRRPLARVQRTKAASPGLGTSRRGHRDRGHCPHRFLAGQELARAHWPLASPPGGEHAQRYHLLRKERMFSYLLKSFLARWNYWSLFEKHFILEFLWKQIKNCRVW